MARAVVLGGYGLIGSACMRALAEAGFDVIGMGRNERVARQVIPQAEWLIRDLTRVDTHEWRKILRGVDVVVNAAGALQESARDDLSGIHETMAMRLVSALEGSSARLVQISAAGVSEDASTEFFRSKARGDAAIQASGVRWVILRPTLVLSPSAYGGTALLRAAAALPMVSPAILPAAQIQTVFVDDLAQAVVHSARGEVASGTIADITEKGSRSLPETVDALRRWLGFPAPRFRLPIPVAGLWFLSRVADGLGWLGWRSPLRSNAIHALQGGVRGNPATWEAAGGSACRSLEDSLATLPSTLQERWFARAYLMFPIIIALLSFFWLSSGIVALIGFDAAQRLLVEHGVVGAAASTVIVGGALADMALGAALLWRPWTRHACLGMILLSVAYLIGGTLVAPDLWADPAGPFVKVLPGTGLALVALGLANER
ncbi:SDR family oxidoreductase [Parvibaculum indicum]|uniref:SDR family oxidoreductase n=1 Tax=Parvibaculum indicum TaxID=562969 RepID=UPI001423F0E0|nr:SDR family oxidoreductase [Parvibaculum indicum]